MGAVESRSVMGLDDLKRYMGLDVADEAHDFILGLMLGAAKQAADTYLNNPFLDIAGLELDIPTPVEIGVLQWAAYNARRKDSTITSKKAGALAETYASPEVATMEIGRAHWAMYRFLPGL